MDAEPKSGQLILRALFQIFASEAADGPVEVVDVAGGVSEGGIRGGHSESACMPAARGRCPSEQPRQSPFTPSVVTEDHFRYAIPRNDSSRVCAYSRFTRFSCGPVRGSAAAALSFESDSR